MPKIEVVKMVNMYEIVEYLCKKNRISIAQMCRDVGLRQGLISDLKHGRTKNLSYENMVKIANYFRISVDVFNEGILEETFPSQNDSKEITGYHHLYKPSDADIKFALFNGDKEISDAQFEEVKRFARYVQERDKRDNK